MKDGRQLKIMHTLNSNALMVLARREVSFIVSIVKGHGLVGRHAARLKVLYNDFCKSCGNEEEGKSEPYFNTKFGWVGKTGTTLQIQGSWSTGPQEYSRELHKFVRLGTAIQTSGELESVTMTLSTRELILRDIPTDERWPEIANCVQSNLHTWD